MKQLHYYHASGGTTSYPYDEEKMSLSNLQKAVGGYIEVLRVRFNGKNCAMVINEDGPAKQLPHNLVASRIAQRPIVGDVVILEDCELS